jgi:glycosyltransferase involved in cell wall biosynthesis
MMADPVRNVLLLAGRLGVHDEGWDVGCFLDRLEARGIEPQVLCAEAAGSAAHDPRVVECPGLASRWRLPLAVRGLRFGERLNPPSLMHVLQTRMSDAGLAIAEHWGLPYVLTIDEFLSPGSRLRLSRRRCCKILANSQALSEDLTGRLGVDPGWVAVVNFGIEAPAEPPMPRSRPKVPVIGTAGPLVTASGFVTFLNAARRVIDAGVDAEFVIAGQGGDEADLRRRAHRLKIADRVTFAGIPLLGLRFWDVLDVFCQTAHEPALGRPLATALAFGVPSVASDVEGLRDLVTHDVNGLLVPPSDSGALATAVIGLLEDSQRAARLGLEGRAFVRRDFHPETEALILVAAYEESLGTAVGPGRNDASGPGAPAFSGKVPASEPV